MNRNLLIIILVAGLAAAAGGLVGAFILAPDEPVALESGTLLTEPRTLPAFSMLRHDREPFTQEEFRGNWDLVFFGFTHCPDVCPNTLFMLDRAMQDMNVPEHDVPRVVFVSVDTERDTPEKMAEYVEYFNPEFIGVTGNTGDLQKLTQAMSVAYEFRPEGDSYTVIHSSTVLAVDPEGRLRAIFTPPLKAAAIAADMTRLVSH